MKKVFILLILFTAYSYLLFNVISNKNYFNNFISKYIPELKTIDYLPISPTPYVTKIVNNTTESPKEIIIVTPIPKQKSQSDDEVWGEAKKIDDHTYTIKIAYDDRMATANEILQALNNYRNQHGQWSLNMDQNLLNYSQTRAQLFADIKTTDKHEGFNDYLTNHDGFKKLGYARLGENSYFGGPLYGVHIIEWVFAKSPEHDANQLYGEWTDVGIGVTDTSVNLIFASNPF